ncbi:MAG: 3-isopropylmalate dehydratase small subunit, partial [Gammaproteobacteria bacterium]|nr:3-isopropylmalate dehydratase small subunit [Gammaproteobacteria bacterium]
GAEVTVDVEARELRLPSGKTVGFPIDPFARHCMLEGVDHTGFLLQNMDNITEFEANRSWQP